MHQSSALAQEKTGEFWVATKMVGGYSRGDFEHCEVALFLGKNPWFSHGIPRARVTLREIANDPARTLIVIDPRRTETAEIADIHLQVKPGGDAFLLAAMIGVIVQEGPGRSATGWPSTPTASTRCCRTSRRSTSPSHAAKSGVPEELVRSAARRIAAAASVATFEDLGVQMNRALDAGLVPAQAARAAHRELRQEGRATYRPSTLVPQAFDERRRGGRRTPVTGARIIGGLTPCNVIPDEILTDHPKRFRAMLVESGNPAHSLADGARMREALAALELVVVIDVAFTETARLAHYVLPVASQFEKAEATFFNFEFPQQLLPPAQGADAAAAGPVLRGGAARAARRGARRAAAGRGRGAARGLARGPRGLPREVLRAGRRDAPVCSRSRRSCSTARSAICCPRASPRAPASGRSARSLRSASRASLARAGFTGAPPEAGDALFDAMLASKSAVVFSVDEWEESFARVSTPNRRIQLAIPELFDELDAPRERTGAGRDARVPVRALRRRAPLVHREHDHPQSGVAEEGPRAARCACIPTTRSARVLRTAAACGSRRGAAAPRSRSRSPTACSPVTSRCRTGSGSISRMRAAQRVATGVAPNELTRSEDRDWVAGTPWHKHTPARVEAL